MYDWFATPCLNSAGRYPSAKQVARAALSFDRPVREGRTSRVPQYVKPMRDRQRPTPRRSLCALQIWSSFPASWSRISLLSDGSSSRYSASLSFSSSAQPAAKFRPYVVRSVRMRVLPGLRLISPLLSRWRCVQCCLFHKRVFHAFDDLLNSDGHGPLGRTHA